MIIVPRPKLSMVSVPQQPGPAGGYLGGRQIGPPNAASGALAG